jgi:hypothetical protein
MGFLLAPPSRTLDVTHGFTIVPTLEPFDVDSCKQYVWAWGEWLDVEDTEIASFEVAVESGPSDKVTLFEAATSDVITEPPEELASARNVCAWFECAEDVVIGDYLVRCRIVTTGGQTEDRSFWLPVRSL